MSQVTPHKHLGFTVHFDELEPPGVITMRKATWEALQLAPSESHTFSLPAETTEPDPPSVPAEEQA